MTNQDEDHISLVELLNDEDVEFAIYDGDDEIASVENYGAAIAQILDGIDYQVGVEQSVGAGMSQSVYLDPEGVIETLLEEIETTDN